ncbi:envelope glycoprotein E [Equid herpesvirus 6]|uniref:Envelope glycoprotein E n=1 Tax=Equid herpesvirus 6 TaxID=173566 RepID=A0A7S9YX61_9ALPH|nr:envelope glycoprotein E [Equid herpesvirus 6]QPI70185.1 envelope glycoprotein E [Equid herpesvirus 6]
MKLAALACCALAGLCLRQAARAGEIHQVQLTEGAYFMIDGGTLGVPDNGTERVLKAWTFLETPRGCAGDVSVSRVCVSRTLCGEEIVVGRRCNLQTVERPLALAEFTAAAGNLTRVNDVYFVNGSVFPILTETRSGLRIAPATTNLAGVYTLHASMDNRQEHYAFLITVKPKGPPKPTAAPAPRRTTTAAPARRHSEFHVRGYHTHVYKAGDTFQLAVHLESEIAAPGFNAEIRWYYMDTSEARDCPMLHVFETCVFHPAAHACLYPENPRCSFTSPLRATKISDRVYRHCRDDTNAWTIGCHSTPWFKAPEYLEEGKNKADLVFRNAPASATGLYVFVLLVNGHPEAWTYTLVATADAFVNVITDLTRPRASEDINTDSLDRGVTRSPAEVPAPGVRGWARRYLAFLIIFASVCGSLIVALLVWGCILCVRCNRKPFEVLNPFGTVYTSVPIDDVLDDVLVFERVAPSRDDSFDDLSDSEEEIDGCVGLPPAPDSPPLPRPPSEEELAAATRRSGYKVWFREDPEPSPPRRFEPPPQDELDYSSVVCKIKSILK